MEEPKQAQAEGSLLQFFTKLGVEDVLPLFQKAGVTTVKQLYAKSFDDWRELGVSYGDCCYLSSSKPEVIPDDDEKEAEDITGKRQQEEEEEARRKREQEEEERAKAEQEEKEREEREKGQDEKEAAATRERKDKARRRRERKKAERQEAERKERERQAQEEQQRAEREAQEERERQEEEQQKRKQQEEEEEARAREEEERAKEEREKEEREREEREKAEQEEERAREEREKAEQEERAKEEREREEREKDQEAAAAKEAAPQPPPVGKNKPVIPSLSLGDVPVVKKKKHIKALSAREPSSSNIVQDDVMLSPRTKARRKKEKKKLKKKERKEQTLDDKKLKKERSEEKKKLKKKLKELKKKAGEAKGADGKHEFKAPLPPPKKVSQSNSVDALPAGGGKGLRGSASTGAKRHKKTLSSGVVSKVSDDISVHRSKEEMLKHLSSMSNRKPGEKRRSPREDMDLRRRNTLSELCPSRGVEDLVARAEAAAKERKVILCQAVVRGFLQRKFFQRWRVAQEILATEQSYVEDLDLIIKHFVLPLEKKVQDNEAIIDKNHIYFIFYNLKDIHAEHLAILRLLKQRLNNRHQFAADSLCDIFDEKVVQPLSSLYFPYVNNFSKSIKALKRCKRDIPAFAEFIEKTEAKRECHLQDLESLLILPIQRVTRYNILLKSLLKQYKPDSTLHERLESTLDLVCEKLDNINECKRDAENLAFVDELTRGFSYEKGPKKIPFSSRRRFIREGTVYREMKSHKEVSRPVRLMLFSDLLVIAEEKEAKKPVSPKGSVKNAHLVKDVIYLVDISMVSLSHANEKECLSFKFHTAKHNYEYHLKNGDACRSWVESISSALAKANEARSQSMRRKAGGNGAPPPVAFDKKPIINVQKGKKDEDDAFSYG